MTAPSGSTDDYATQFDALIAILDPGDRVLIGIENEDLDARSLADSLRERFPGVEFTIVNSVRGMAILEQKE